MNILFWHPFDLKSSERIIADLLIEFQKHGKINYRPLKPFSTIDMDAYQ